MSFIEKLDPEALAFFTDLVKQPFAKQGVAFLNAYWTEVGSQAPFIFEVAYETIRFADMHFKGVTLIHLYDEGNDMDYNAGMYFYEKLCKKVLDSPEGAKWRDDPLYAPSLPTFLTAIVRKKELREKVDVKFSGRVSFLEYLLYQYRDWCSPTDFVQRSMKQEGEHPEITKARLALEDVTAAIRAYEQEKARLEAESELPGVKGLSAKNQLAQLQSSPLLEKLNTALIKAEAAVRKANKLFGGMTVSEGGDGEEGGGAANSAGSLFWMNSDLNAKQALYGKKGGSSSSKSAMPKAAPPPPPTMGKPMGGSASPGGGSGSPRSPSNKPTTPPAIHKVPVTVAPIASKAKEEEDDVDPSAPRACDAFQLDMSASTFGTCKCGFKKTEHSNAALNAKPISRGHVAALAAGGGAAAAVVVSSVQEEEEQQEQPMTYAEAAAEGVVQEEEEETYQEEQVQQQEEESYQQQEEEQVQQQEEETYQQEEEQVQEEESYQQQQEETTTPGNGFVIAQFDAQAEEEGDLEFKTGDRIQVVEVIDDNWIKGSCDGKEGLVPMTFVGEIQYD